MPAIIKNARGDINKLNRELDSGELFWSYINKDPVKSNGHTYSKGQLWIKDPEGGLVAIGGTEANRSLRLAGRISDNFNGDFLNANVTNQIEFAKCTEGDVFIFDKTFEGGNQAYFTEPFYKGDFLVITKAVYGTTDSNIFVDRLIEVEYIRIPGADFDKSKTDLDADNLQEAIEELELRLLYNGIISDMNSYNKATKKKGFMYLSKAYLTLNSSDFELVEGEDYEGRFTGSRIKLRYGDFIFWNGSKWVLIPSGEVLANLAYSVQSEIDSIETFEDYHKNILKNITNVQDALDILCSEKAPLDKNHKIPYSVLPDSVKSGLVYMGTFEPVDVNETDFNNPDNQKYYPAPIDDEGNELDVWNSGWFYIVNTFNKVNVQYKDKDNGRIIELNSGDWVVYNKHTGRFEVVDNSDRVSAITVHTSSGKEVTLLGNVKIKSTSDFLHVEVSDDVIDLQLTDDLATKGENGKPNYLPIYDSLGTRLLNSCLHENNSLTELISDLGLIIGSKTNEQFIQSFGDITLEPTIAEHTATLSKNPVLNLINILNDGGVNLHRTNKIIGSTKLNFVEDGEVEEVNEITLPETDSRLIASLTGDELSTNYLTKTNSDGFVTNSSVYDDEDAVTIKNGQLNVKNTANHLVELYPEDSFIKVTKAVTNPTTGTTDVVEYSLQPGDIKAQLKINPFTIEDAATIVVYMPRRSGTLITEEYVKEMYSNGVALMIPTWELHSRDGEDYIGLSSSPITIRVNRKKSGNEKQDRENDLSYDYGKGLKSAWSYIGSQRIESAQDKEQGSKSDIVSFDAWVEAQRAIASKEAFVLPSTALLNDNSKYNDNRNSITQDTEKPNDQLGKEGGLTAFTSIVPSRSVYKWDPAYYDAFGKLLDQEITKVVELPAESGVLVTHNSVLRAPIYKTPNN